MKKKSSEILIILFSGFLILIFFVLFFLLSHEESGFVLTEQEKLWIEKNPVVKVVPTPNFPPIDYTDLKRSVHKGMAADYLNEISKITGLEFEYVFTPTWHEGLDVLKMGGADMITSAQETDERKKYLSFTSSYVDVENTLIVNTDLNKNLSLKKMKNKKLGIIKGYAVEDYIRKNYPEIEVVHAEDVLEAMFFLSMGKVDGIIANVPVILYFKSKNMVGNLKIAEVIDYEYNLSFGIRSDLEVLYSVIEKALASVPQKKKDEISDKWIQLKFKRFFEDRLFIGVFLLSAGLLLVMFFLVLLWRKKAMELDRAKQEAEKAMDKAHEADAAKSKFLANISHEIRTPMNSVLGFAELLNEEELSAKAKTYISNIKNSGRTLLNLIDDILDMSKIEAGRFEMYYQPCDFKSVLETVKSEFRVMAEGKKLEFNISSDPRIPKFLLLDELRIKQIIVNLVGNSIKFTEKGYVDIVSYPEFKGGDLTAIDLFIQVKDSGIGIPLSEQEKIFAPFTQQNGQDSREYGGTGLGLAITKKLVEMMNGEITLESEPGKGSCFSVVLRDVVLPDLDTSRQYESARCFSSIRFLKKTEILMADHDTSDKEFVSYLLKPYGIRLFQVSDSREAVNFLTKRLPDIILLNMNILDGKSMDVIEYIEKNQLIKRVMVVAVSGDAKFMRSRGISGYLEKPFTRDALISQLIKFIPYSREESLESEHLKSTSDYFSMEDIEALHRNPEYSFRKFCETFDLVIMNKWMEAQRSFIFSDICEFADELIDSGDKFKVKCFVLYGKDIKGFADDFDIENLKPLLRIYPGLVKEIKKYLKREK